MSVLQRVSPGTVALFVLLEEATVRFANSCGAHITELQAQGAAGILAILGLIVLHLAGKVNADEAEVRVAELEKQLEDRPK